MSVDPFLSHVDTVGTPDPEATTYTDRYPTLRELIRYGGIPGFEYALVLSSDVGRLQRDGWGRVRDLPDITIVGPSGTHSASLVARGERILGAAIGAYRCPYRITHSLVESTGITAGVDDPRIGGRKVTDSEKAAAAKQGPGPGERKAG